MMPKKEIHKMKKYKIGFICGFFDLLHDGHISILKQAQPNCDHLIVAVGTDELLEKRKNRKPILTYPQRVEIIKSIRYVDEVVPETNLDKLSAYRQFHFDVMFAGDDHLHEDLYINTANELKKLGVDTIFVPRIINCSSTYLRSKVLEIQGSIK